MGTFNLNFDQFKPSSRGGVGTPLATPTPVSSPPPSTPIPKPVQPAPQQLTQSNPIPSVPVTSSKGNYMTGSFWSKLLDIPMTPYYALAGFNKGTYGERATQRQSGNFSNWGGKRLVAGIKSIIPGINNRAGFGNQIEDVNLAKEAGIKNEGLQSAANLALSLAVPSLPIGKVGKIVAKVPGISHALTALEKVGGKVSQFAKETPALYNTIEKVSPYFRRPEVGKMVAGAEGAATGRVSKLYTEIYDLAKGLTSQQQQEVGRVIEGAKSTDKQIVAIAKEAQRIGSEIGQELIDQNLLPKNTKLGEYLPHIFEQAKTGFTSSAPKVMPKFIGNFFKKRTGAEGYLPEFAPSLFKGLGSEAQSLEVNNLYKDIVSKYGTRVTRIKNVPEGMVWARDVVKNPQLQKLFKYTAIPQDIADYMSRVTQYVKPGIVENLINKVWKPLKTIYNPAYHARNLYSNQILSDMATGEGAVNTLKNTVTNLIKPDSKFVNAAKEVGLIGRQSITKGFEDLKSQASGLNATKNIFGRLHSGLQGMQTGSEELSKLTTFKSLLEKTASNLGITVEEALKNKNLVKDAADAAEKAIFSPYRISAAERSIASKYIPFYSFTRQAIPFTLKTLAENPARITKYTKVGNAVEDLSGDNKIPVDRRSDIYKNQIQLPSKDKTKANFFDLSYIYPWGNLDSGGKSKLPFGLSLRPDLQSLIDLSTNKDYFGKKIMPAPLTSKYWKENTAGVAKYFSNLFEPAAAGGVRKIISATQGKPDQYGKERTLPQSILEAIGGLKQTKVDPNTMIENLMSNKLFSNREEQAYLKQLEKDRLLRSKK